MLFPIGFLIGIVMTAPIGGVNIMCLRKSLSYGFSAGFICATGAIVADAIFATIAIFGIGYASALIEQYQTIIQFSGGIIVIVFGLIIFRHKNSFVCGNDNRKADPGGPFSSFVLTATNPGTVFGFTALFSTLGKFVSPSQNTQDSALLLLGVIIGCTTWWIGVTGLASHYREKLSVQMLIKVNRTTGVVLIVFGCFILVGILIRLDYWMFLTNVNSPS